MRVKQAILFLVLVNVQAYSFPRFKDYLADIRWRRTKVKLHLDTHNKKLFRTRLMEAFGESPDFAGHYRVAGWGCGSVCAGGALIDLNTGRVFPLPFGGNGKDDEYWIFAGGVFPERYMEYRKNSRLMIIRRSESAEFLADDFYFLWEGDKFRQIKHVTAAQLSRKIK